VAARQWRAAVAGLAPALALIAALLVAVLAQPAGAQGQPGAEATAAQVDYDDWNRMAEKAEAELGDANIADARLDELRGQLAKWRAAFLTAQTANSARIATVKEQIAALGAAPAEGETEAPEIAARRAELADQLVKLQAPGIAAEEAYRRADGLIREIDSIQRERQADKLLQLWPAPVNPANWPEAAVGLTDTLLHIWNEPAENWDNSARRAAFLDNLPLIGVLLVIWAALAIYARRWIERFADRLQAGGSVARRRVLALLASTGQVIVPVLGMIALATALVSSTLLGDVTGAVAMALPFLGLEIFTAAWLGLRAFPRVQGEHPVLPLPDESRREGRVLAAAMGLVLAVETLRRVAMEPQAYSDAVTAVAEFPILVAGGILLWRVGRLLKQARGAEDTPSYMQSLLALMGRAVRVIGLVAPLIAAAGYVAAGMALIYPAILTLALVTFGLVLQRLVSDLWAMASAPSEGDASDGLVPVLAGFALTLISLPLLALIWGARSSDLTELWTRFREGFQMGDTRISPSVFLLFVIIFLAGYLVTRLFQGALKNSILPRTRLDRGGQTAIVSGTGYVGIFLAALVAINATGIDLSGLAIVAGALSVGIGFGLQNIVQNFVSGIILLIERPVSEGDWIEVGGVQGIVKSISVRSTKVQTFDRTMVIVPNGDLVSQQVKNWTRFGLAGRLIVPVGVAFGTDTLKVEQVLREIAEAQPLVVLNPPPNIVFQGFGADAMNFEIRVILRDVNFSLQVRSDINHAIVKRFAEEGIDIPFAQSEITLRNAEELGRALAGLPLQAGAAQAMPAAAAAPPAPRPGTPEDYEAEPPESAGGDDGGADEPR
jgi:potassium efflux system protein